MITKLIIPVVLQLLGVGVIITEFIVPSAGILATISIGIFGYSLFYVFTKVSAAAGYAFIIADLLMIPFLVILGTKMLAASKATLRSSLSGKDGTISQPPEWAALPGKEGIAGTALHPAGSVMIENTKYDVVSSGAFIDKGKPVVVVTVDGNRIVVKEKESLLADV